MTDSIRTIKLHDIRVSENTLWRHLVVETADGVTGTGEYTLGNAGPNLQSDAARLLRPFLGKAPSPALARPPEGAGLETCAILSALEQALCDVEAAQQGRPVWQSLAPETAPAPLHIYANINRRTEDRSPAGFEASARLAMRQGFRHFKVAPFDDLVPEICGTAEGRARIDAGLARVAAVAGCLAPDLSLMVDCHWRFTPDAAAETLAALADMGVGWFECPLPEVTDNIAALANLRALAHAHDMRLAGLEMSVSPDQVLPFLKAGAYDVIMPDVKYAGGCHGILEMAKLARGYGTAVSIHNPSGPIAHMASVHTALALDNGQLLEMQFDESPMFTSIVSEMVLPEAGTVVPPAAPGLGCALTPQAIAGATSLDVAGDTA
ncbi:enolase C-terminal domain-like protein [Fluviibacterium sp. DFM31]|uniref:Enolase C-terminal domain-like protein n=1 Tax=Meridianimarinicoccus marinus TaxID=3231483 RepID=A0ABV3LBG2_9RHOB